MNGAELRAIRELHGATQDEFAKQIGISRVYLGLLERNQRPISASVELAAKKTPRIRRDVRPTITDYTLRDVEKALINAGYQYRLQFIPGSDAAEFHLEEIDLYLIASRSPIELNELEKSRRNQIVAAGKGAISVLTQLIKGENLFGYDQHLDLGAT